jgi:Ser/Thr protein kinase RdoA (MazF antagonist)
MAQPHDPISADLAALYRKKPGEIRFIARVQNDIFGYSVDREEYILRLTPATHRRPEQVMAEIEWVNYLLGQGVPATQPVASATGRFCTVIENDDNSEYHWFVADLSTALFEAATCCYQKLPRAEFIKRFLDDFLSGYRQEYEFGDRLKHLPSFIKLRETSIYIILRKRWADRVLTPFQNRFFESLRESVLQDRAFIDPKVLSQ